MIGMKVNVSIDVVHNFCCLFALCGCRVPFWA